MSHLKLSKHVPYRRHAKAWLVQLAIGTKKNVAEVIKYFPFEMSELQTQATLNILPLGSYDVLLKAWIG
jgi:hypothetical protein